MWSRWHKPRALLIPRLLDMTLQALDICMHRMLIPNLVLLNRQALRAHLTLVYYYLICLVPKTLPWCQPFYIFPIQVRCPRIQYGQGEFSKRLLPKQCLLCWCDLLQRESLTLLLTTSKDTINREICRENYAVCNQGLTSISWSCSSNSAVRCF